VPVSLGSSLAIGISEGIAGAVGGLASRRAADAIGDSKVDSVLTKVSATGAFFGSRGVIIGFSRALGLPRPLAVPLASLLASLISELTKAAGRSHASQNSTIDSNKNFLSDLDPGEIVGDIAKWLVYDALDDGGLSFIPSCGSPESPVSLLAASSGYGAISALASALIRDIILRLEGRLSTKPLPARSYKYFQAGLEGAVLFGCYKASVLALQAVAPDSLNTKFIFDQIIEELEEDIEALK
jgi:hypothetical protein